MTASILLRTSETGTQARFVFREKGHFGFLFALAYDLWGITLSFCVGKRTFSTRFSIVFLLKIGRLVTSSTNSHQDPVTFEGCQYGPAE
jgi:hypothetical protein